MSTWQPPGPGCAQQLDPSSKHQHGPAVLQQVPLSSSSHTMQQAAPLAGSTPGMCSTVGPDHSQIFGGQDAACHISASTVLQVVPSQRAPDPLVTSPCTPLQPAQHTSTHSSPNHPRTITPLPTAPAQQLHTAYAAIAGFSAAPAAKSMSLISMEAFGPNVLDKLQGVTATLATAVQLHDMQQIQFCVQLLSCFPVTTRLLISSQAAVTVRQLLQQLRVQRAGKQHKLPQDCQLFEQVAQDVQQLLLRWRSVLESEVSAVGSDQVSQARQLFNSVTKSAGRQVNTACRKGLPPSGHKRHTSQPQPTASTPSSRKSKPQPCQQHSKQHSQPRPAKPLEARKRQQSPAATAVALSDAPVKRQKLSSNRQHQILLPSGGQKPVLFSSTIQKQHTTTASRRVATTAAAGAHLSWSLTAAAAGKKHPKTVKDAGPSDGEQPSAQPVCNISIELGPGTAAAADDAVLAKGCLVDHPPPLSGNHLVTAAAAPYTATRARARKSRYVSQGPADKLAASVAVPTNAQMGAPAALTGLAAVAVTTGSASIRGRIKLSAGITKISPASQAGASKQQRSTAATAAAGPGSMMWGAGARALRAARGPGHHHRDHHKHQVQHYDHDLHNDHQRSKGPEGDMRVSSTGDQSVSNRSIHTGVLGSKQAGIPMAGAAAAVAAVGDGSSDGLPAADDLLVDARQLGGYKLGMAGLMMSPELQ